MKTNNNIFKDTTWDTELPNKSGEKGIKYFLVRTSELIHQINKVVNTE